MVQTTPHTDTMLLSELNTRFISNFINMDSTAHSELIHEDFICINSDGSLSDRKEYLDAWASGYKTSGYTSFSITDEHIRVFGNVALVRSKTVYTKRINGELVEGNSIYTDTYVKENGRWWCVQAQITPVRHK
jgi:ketosteroid isomerase-like protein